MYRSSSTSEWRPVTPVQVACSTFLLLWVVQFTGLAWGSSGSMPAGLMAAFDFVFVDVLYMTGWRLSRGLLPASSVGFYAASGIGYAILAVVAATWFHVLKTVRSSG